MVTVRRKRKLLSSPYSGPAFRLGNLPSDCRRKLSRNRLPVRIEERCYRASVGQALRQNLEPMTGDRHQPALGEWLQRLADRAQDVGAQLRPPTTKQPLDYRPAATVVGSSDHASVCRQGRSGTEHAIAAAVLFVLCKQFRKTADRRCAQSDQDVAGIVGEPLKVTPQGPIKRRAGKRVPPGLAKWSKPIGA